MAFRVFQNPLQLRKAISAVLALLIAGLAASYYGMERREWLAHVTLEVQATSASGMGRATPTRAALLLQHATAEKKVLQTKDWTGATAKPFSRLRFEVPRANYQQIVFFPDPSLQEVEIVRVRLIPHSGGNATEVSLDRVQNQQASVTSSRTAESIRFQRSSGANIMAITLDVADLLGGVPSSLPRLLETIFIFLGAFLTAYLCALLFADWFNKARALPLSGEPVQPPYLRLGVMLGLVACMAAAAPGNSHPDEHLHIETAKYYVQHWLPPSLDDEWIIPTLSHYGLTYLSETDLGYFFAGKFALFLQPLFPDIFSALRFFNVALLVILAVWSARSFPKSAAVWIFFLTPQVWYVFASYNTEGWALFISFLLIGQLASKGSSLHQGLASTASGSSITLLLPTLALSGLLALAKRNFLFVFFFFITWLLWQLMTRRELGDLRGTIKIISLLLVPLLLRYGVQNYQSAVNHFDLPHAIQEQAEKYANPDYKPSAMRAHIDDSKSPHLRERGITLREVVIEHQWLSRTITSFFGTYGWMTISSPDWFYLMMGAGWIIFIGCTLVATVMKPPRPERIFCGVAWLFLPWIAITALYFSWTSDFQPQGRYLFPFLPILFYVINAVNPGPRRLLSATVWTLFIISAYGFISFGLRALTQLTGLS